jgi:hypothetical protein
MSRPEGALYWRAVEEAQRPRHRVYHSAIHTADHQLYKGMGFRAVTNLAVYAS